MPRASTSFRTHTQDFLENKTLYMNKMLYDNDTQGIVLQNSYSKFMHYANIFRINLHNVKYLTTQRLQVLAKYSLNI